MQTVLRVLLWFWRLLSDADTAFGAWSVLAIVASTVAGLFVGLAWYWSVIIGLLISFAALLVIGGVFFVIERVQSFVDRQSGKNVPGWLINNANDQLRLSEQRLLYADERTASITKEIGGIDPRLIFIIPVKNETVFDFRIEGVRGAVSYAGDRLTGTPSYNSLNPTIDHNGSRSIHVSLPISPTFRDSIANLSPEEISSQITLDLFLMASTMGLHGEAVEIQIRVPRDYFLSKG